MDSSGIRPTEWAVALGGVLLLVALFFFDWYELEPRLALMEIGASFLVQIEPAPDLPALPQLEQDLGAWDEQGFLGTIANLVMLAAGVWAIVAVWLRSSVGNVEMRTDTTTITALLGIAASVMVLLRIVFPVEEVGGFEFEADPKFGIFLALAGALLIAIGGLMGRGAPPVPPSGSRAAAPQPPSPPPPSEGMPPGGAAERPQG